MIRKIMPLLLLGLFLSGCDKRDKSTRDAAVLPSIAGQWTGNIKVNGTSTLVTLMLQQQGALVQGNYTADGNSAVLGTSGTISGATTGPAFSLDVAGNPPACITTFKIGGENSGTELSFNLIGSDCHGTSLSGESFLNRPT